MDSIEGVADGERSAPRRLSEARALERHHTARLADQRAWPRRVLKARQRRLRAERSRVGQAPVGELEQRVVAEAVGIVAVLLAGGDHQQAKTQHLGEAMLDALRRARVADAGGEAPGHSEAFLDLTQRQQPTVGRERPAVEAGDDRIAGHW